MTLAGYFAVAVPLSFLVLVAGLDRSHAVRPLRVTLCLLWGLIAFGVAYEVDSALVASGMISAALMVTIVAPIVEEALKALAVVTLAARGRLSSVVDGAIYGFASGAAFAAAENVLYLSRSDSGIALAVGRAFTTSLMHCTSTAFIGASLGKRRATAAQAGAHRLASPALTVVLGLVRGFIRQRLLRGAVFQTSILEHVSFNELISRPVDQLVLLLALLFGIGSVVLIAVLIVRAQHPSLQVSPAPAPHSATAPR